MRREDDSESITDRLKHVVADLLSDEDDPLEQLAREEMQAEQRDDD